MPSDNYVDLDTVLNTAAGITPTADYFDQLRINFEALFNASTCRAYASGAQTLTTATLTALTLNSERWDNGGLHDTVTNNSRITADTAGVGLFIGSGLYAAGSGGTQRSLILRANGATQFAQIDVPPNGAAATEVCVMQLWKLAAGEYVELCGYHDRGSNLGLTGELSALFVSVG